MITPENQEINKFRKRQFNNFTQITMPYLAGFIDETRYEINLIDEYNQDIPYYNTFDLVAITVNTPNANHCYNISELFRKRGIKVIMGGPHATLLPDEVSKHCDYIIIGEAENTWPQFLEDFYNDNPKQRYMSKDAPELNNIPIPRRDLIGKRYFTRGAVFATRGCPYNCSYCNLKQIYHNCFRKRPINELISDIKTINSKYFVFWDDNLFSDKTYAKELLLNLKRLKKKWAAQVTLKDCEDRELLNLAKSAGCIYLFVGLESFSDDTLINVNKEINKIDDYKRIIDLIHEYKIMIQAGIVFGFDTDDKLVFSRTLKICENLGIDGATISILTPLPRTPIYNKMKLEGRLITEDWSYYNGKTRVAFSPKNMSCKELYEGYMWFRKNFYSLKSFKKRMKASKTNIFYNFIINLGYKLSIR
ncbi:B12-binding domain-containing radical SAM protein [Anaeromonas frigoriresistens]|nr:radical SAM protein [Anaeromonas frigoriresistens]